MRLRTAAVGDVDALVRLETALFVEDAATHEPYADATWPEREGRKDFEDLLASERSIVLVADGEPAIAGFLVGYLTDSSPTRQPHVYAVLRSMYVTPEQRRNGVAGALTRDFIEWARENGAAEAHVDHYAANTGAQALYERHGFIARSISRVLPLRP